MGLCQSDLAVSAENPQSAIENEPDDRVQDVDAKSNNGFVYVESRTSLSSNKDDPDSRQVEDGIIDNKIDVSESPKSESSFARSSVINFNESSEDSILDDEILEQRLVALKDDSEKRTLRSVIRTPKCPVDPGMPTQYQLVFSDAEMYEFFEINAEQYEHDAHIRFAKNGETKVVVCGIF